MNSGLGPPESGINQDFSTEDPSSQMNLAYDKDPGTACDFA